MVTMLTETDRQAGGQAWAGRQTDRETDRERERERPCRRVECRRVADVHRRVQSSCARTTETTRDE